MESGLGLGLGLGLEPAGPLERVHGDQYIADQGVDLVHLVRGRVRGWVRVMVRVMVRVRGRGRGR